MGRVVLAALLAGISLATVANAQDGNKPASPATIEAQRAAADALPPDGTRDSDFSLRGFLATRNDPIIRNADGQPVWNLDAYAFVKGDAPATVHPSLWRHMRYLKHHGLFEVAEGVWQVRGFDLSNMTIIRGQSGWIVIDPLTGVETAKAAMALVNQTLGTRPVSAVSTGAPMATPRAYSETSRPAEGRLTCRSAAMVGIRPTMTNSVVPMAKALSARIINERGIARSLSELLAHLLEEGLDGFLVAFEEVPLADLLAADQPRALQRRQVGRDRRLRQAAALVDLPGTHTVFGAVMLVGEAGVRVFQPVQDFSPYWVGQGFYYFVEIKRHGWARGGYSVISRWGEI